VNTLESAAPANRVSVAVVGTCVDDMRISDLCRSSDLTGSWVTGIGGSVLRWGPEVSCEPVEVAAEVELPRGDVDGATM